MRVGKRPRPWPTTTTCQSGTRLPPGPQRLPVGGASDVLPLQFRCTAHPTSALDNPSLAAPPGPRERAHHKDGAYPVWDDLADLAMSHGPDQQPDALATAEMLSPCGYARLRQPWSLQRWHAGSTAPVTLAGILGLQTAELLPDHSGPTGRPGAVCLDLISHLPTADPSLHSGQGSRKFGIPSSKGRWGPEACRR